MNVAVVGAIASRACSKPKLFRLVVSDNKQTNKQMEKKLKKWEKYVAAWIAEVILQLSNCNY